MSFSEPHQCHGLSNSDVLLLNKSNVSFWNKQNVLLLNRSNVLFWTRTCLVLSKKTNCLLLHRVLITPSVFWYDKQHILNKTKLLFWDKKTVSSFNTEAVSFSSKNNVLLLRKSNVLCASKGSILLLQEQSHELCLALEQKQSTPWF